MKKASWATDLTTTAPAGKPAQGEGHMEKNDHLPPWAHYFKVNVRDLGLEVLLSMVPDIAVHLVNGIEAIKEKFDALKLPLPEEIRTSLTGPIEKAVELLGIKPAVAPTPSPAPVPPAAPPASVATASVEPPKEAPAPVAPVAAPATPPKKAPAIPPALPVATTAPAVKTVAKPVPAAKVEPPKAPLLITARTLHAAAATTAPNEPAKAVLPKAEPSPVASKPVMTVVEPLKATTIPATSRVATLVPKKPEEPKEVRRVVTLAASPKIAPTPQPCQYRKNRDDNQGCDNNAKPHTVACTEHSTPCPTCHRNLVPVWMANKPMFDRKTGKKIIIDGNEIGSHCHDCAAQIFKNYQNPDWNWVINQPKPEQIQADAEYDVDFYEKLRAAEPTDPEPADVDDERDGDGDAVPMIDATDVVVIDDGTGEEGRCDFFGPRGVEDTDEHGEFHFDAEGRCVYGGAIFNKDAKKNFCSRHQKNQARRADRKKKKEEKK